MNNILINVWVYSSMLDDFLNGDSEGYLYPSEQRYQTQLLIPYDELEFHGEKENTCRRYKF